MDSSRPAGTVPPIPLRRLVAEAARVAVREYFAPVTGVVSSIEKIDRLGLAFGAATLLGFIGVVGGGYFDSTPLTMGLPLTALLGYSAVAIGERRSQELRAQAADNAYYLGYLFTLLALIVSLVELGRASDIFDASARLRTVGFEPVETNLGRTFWRFGLGLTASLVGLALRVALTNPSGEEDGGTTVLAAIPEEAPSQARAFKDFPNVMALTEIFETQAAQMTRFAHENAEMLGRSVERFSDVAEASASLLDQQNRHLERLDGIHLSLERQLEAALSEHVSELKRTADVLGDVSRRDAQSLRTISEAVSEFSESAKRLGDELQVIARLRDRLETDALGLRALRNQLDRDATRARRSLRKLRRTVAKAFVVWRRNSKNW